VVGKFRDDMESPIASVIRSHFPTPVGQLAVFTRGDALLAMEFSDQGKSEQELERHWPGISITPGTMPPAISHALKAYFADACCRAFDKLDLRPCGSPFQQLVWAKLRSIPPGKTISYGMLAQLSGRPGSARAVGSANGRNPIPIIIPCHRVIGANGTLTGYGSGLERKAWLLRHEGVSPASVGQLELGVV